MYDIKKSPYVGMDTETLKKNLMIAQAAYAQIMAGSQIVETSYMQGDCNMQVVYKPTDQASLLAYIQSLQAAVGVVKTPRRAITFRGM